jgi:hypothetical protein
MSLKWADLTPEQVAFLQRFEEEFSQKFGDNVYVIAIDKK